jgi:hypothetical protein
LYNKQNDEINQLYEPTNTTRREKEKESVREWESVSERESGRA